MPFLLSHKAWGGRSLDWTEALNAAKIGNPDLLTAQENYRAAAEQWKSNFAGFFPQISAQAAWNRNGLVSGPNNPQRSSIGLVASQSLFSGFQDIGRVRQARAAREGANWALRSARAKVSADLKSAYAGLIYTEELKRLSETIIKRRTNNLNLVELRFNSGRENKGALLLSQASLEQARLEKMRAENLRRQASVQLAEVLGIDPTEDLTLMGKTPVMTPDKEADFNSLVQSAPEYQQAIEKEKSAEAAITISRAAFYPNLSLSGGVQKIRIEGSDPSDSWSVDLNLNIPLFNGGRDFFATRAASSTYAAARIQSEGLRRDLYLRFEQAFGTYRENVQKVVVDQNLKDAMTVRAEIARSQYNNGLIAFGDWDQIENDLINTEKNLLQSQRDRVTAEGSWELLQGKGVIE